MKKFSRNSYCLYCVECSTSQRHEDGGDHNTNDNVTYANHVIFHTFIEIVSFIVYEKTQRAPL